MGVGLQPLEFTECLADSPQFRENLQRHEKELERTSQQIKRLIKEVKDVVQAAKRLGAAQLALATSMEQFEFACIGASMTEDERVISHSLHHFATLIRTIEDERDRMLGRAHEQIIQPLERFRKEHIGAVKEGKKKFDKKTAKFCQSQERTLSLSTKKPEAVFQEADAAMDMAERDFCQASLEYVFQLQAVQERKKFELVETLLGFVFGWWTFHHTAHDVHADAEPRVKDLQLRIQRTRGNFEEMSKQTESLMKKMMELRQMVSAAVHIVPLLIRCSKLMRGHTDRQKNYFDHIFGFGI
ncbi:rho GTPase-activating protein 26 [Spodoptera litura]|uniref:Rho GTPase-activating protein 26 n=1 Tax=Spodoptera litura TaxID=69820 RepID=A0A9J7E9D1_SPOLT|nr:rho GTPase-activating protein 26 [Spodoptera litura]